jgi:uncharacterized protein YjeT (DUF2065 family)
MDRSIPILALGIVFGLGGIALFAFAMREKDKLESTTPKRKSDERGLAVDKKNNAKLRTAGGILAGFGAVLIAVSQL